MLLQPFLGSWIALKTFAWPVLPALAAVLGMFLIREPLLVLARQKWVWREQKPETAAARRRLAFELAGLLAAGVWLLAVWPWWIVIVIGGAAGALTAAAVWVTILNRQRNAWFQALSAAGLSSSCVPACLALTGTIPSWCWWWWALHAAHFLGGILVVHLRLEARIQARTSPAGPAPAYLAMRRRAAAAAMALAGAGAALALEGQLCYAAAMLFSGAVHARGAYTAHTAASVALPMASVGKRALAVSIVFTLLMIAGVWRA
jgi:hypothetical protein